MKLRKHPVLIFILVMLSLHSISQKWDLKTDKDGVKVYTRSIEGSNVHEFRGEVTVKSNLSGVLSLIDSVPEYTKWMKNCIESERIKKITPSSGYSYYVIKAPWPVSDRDACNYYKVSQDSVTRIITVSLIGKKDYLPEKSGRVRVPVLNGSWQLIPVAKWVTKIVYQVHCDIGGIVPAAIVNMYITDTPFYNLLNIKNIVEAPLYPKIVRKDVKEL
jgi:hypothetical protein